MSGIERENEKPNLGLRGSVIVLLIALLVVGGTAFFVEGIGKCQYIDPASGVSATEEIPVTIAI